MDLARLAIVSLVFASFAITGCVGSSSSTGNYEGALIVGEHVLGTRSLEQGLWDFGLGYEHTSAIVSGDLGIQVEEEGGTRTDAGTVSIGAPTGRLVDTLELEEPTFVRIVLDVDVLDDAGHITVHWTFDR